MKKCPFCAEEIRAEAIKCKHCGSFISPGICKKCGKQNDSAVMICKFCGSMDLIQNNFKELSEELIAALRLIYSRKNFYREESGTNFELWDEVIVRKLEELSFIEKNEGGSFWIIHFDRIETALIKTGDRSGIVDAPNRNISRHLGKADIGQKQFAKFLNILEYAKPIFATLASIRMQMFDSKKGWFLGHGEYDNLFIMEPGAEGEMMFDEKCRRFQVAKLYLGDVDEIEIIVNASNSEKIDGVISDNFKDFKNEKLVEISGIGNTEDEIENIVIPIEEFVAQVINLKGKDFNQYVIDCWKDYADLEPLLIDTTRCLSCGMKIEDDSVFCGHCGASLKGSPPSIPCFKKVSPVNLKAKQSGLAGLLVECQNKYSEHQNRQSAIEIAIWNRKLALDYARLMRDCLRYRKMVTMAEFQQKIKNNPSLRETKDVLLNFNNVAIPCFERALMHLSEYSDKRILAEPLFKQTASTTKFDCANVDLEMIINLLLRGKLLIEANSGELSDAYKKEYGDIPAWATLRSSLFNSYEVLVSIERWVEASRVKYSEEELSQLTSELQSEFDAFMGKLYQPILKELRTTAMQLKQQDTLEQILDSQKSISDSIDVVAAEAGIAATASSISATKDVIDWLKSR